MTNHTKASALILRPELFFKNFAKILFSNLTIITFCLFFAGKAIAQDSEIVSATDSSASVKIFNQAINMCPGAIAFGMLSFNYEYLFNQTHGIVARFDYDKISETFSDDKIEADGIGFTLNYRWHWSGAMESSFLGSYIRYRFYDGTGISNSTKFDFTMPEFTVGLNIGKRWVWNSGINIVVSFGYGYSWFSTETNPKSDDIDSTLKEFKDEYTFLGPFLGEFSLGYAF